MEDGKEANVVPWANADNVPRGIVERTSHITYNETAGYLSPSYIAEQNQFYKR